MDSSLAIGMTPVGRVSNCGVCHGEEQSDDAVQTGQVVPKMGSSLWLGMTDKACMDCERGDAIYCSGMIAVFNLNITLALALASR
ncbi:MAG: hypothetical protein HY22_02685 [[Candidatus Thermochlorobacteriaceae] bacterium GBChlB]|nr:MAG: hypothetical protein HY22_02685 [[Candidatus Thermochlorobacteriaceae] bacterium GBChlB]